LKPYTGRGNNHPAAPTSKAGEEKEIMGLDLTLLPFDSETVAFSHTVLNCNRTYALFDALVKEPAMKVPDGFTTYLSRDDKYEDTHYGITTETPYGEPLMFVELESLLKYKDHPSVVDVPKNRAVWAYLACLPPRTKVALFWH
jgi:hypothetical protein